jgi:hypothetical protein
MWFKNKNTKTNNKNVKYVKQMWKWIFIMLTYASMNIKRTWQGNETIKDTKTHKNKSQRKGLSLFSNKEQDKIAWFKNKNIKTKNKNMRWARQTWKWIFIILTYVNMNKKRTWRGYGARLCLRLMLNRLKEMKGLISIYTPLGT